MAPLFAPVVRGVVPSSILIHADVVRIAKVGRNEQEKQDSWVMRNSIWYLLDDLTANMLWGNGKDL